MRHLITTPANPGASSSAVLFDSGDIAFKSLAPRVRGRYLRCRIGFYTDVADAVFKVDWYAPGSTNARSVASTTVGAAAFFERDTLLMPGRTRIYITTTTAPATWEVGVEMIDNQDLAQ